MYKQPLIPSVLLMLALLVSQTASARTKIAVLDFELNDITSLPNTPEEKRRTASIKPLLEQALSQAGDYELVPVSADAYAKANGSFGYLFHFGELAAQLGQQAGADWVVVGQHSKPSFLFSYLMAHLIQVQSASEIATYDIELKGNHEKVTQRGVMSLAKKITAVINK